MTEQITVITGGDTYICPAPFLQHWVRVDDSRIKSHLEIIAMLQHDIANKQQAVLCMEAVAEIHEVRISKETQP